MILTFNKKSVKACRVMKFGVKKRPRCLFGSTLDFLKDVALVESKWPFQDHGSPRVMLRTDTRTAKDSSSSNNNKATKYQITAACLLN